MSGVSFQNFMDHFGSKGDAQLSQGLNSFLSFFEDARLNLDTFDIEHMLEMGNGVFRARIVPDNCMTELFSGFAAPCDGGFTLVRDTCNWRVSDM